MSSNQVKDLSMTVALFNRLEHLRRLLSPPDATVRQTDRSPWLDAAISLAIFSIVLGVHVWSPVLMAYDSVWSIHVAASMIAERNVDLDEYRDFIDAEGPMGSYKLEFIDDSIYFYFPNAPSLFAVPVILAAEPISDRIFGVENLLEYIRAHPPGHITALLEKITGAWVVALAAVFLYLIARHHLNIRRALLLVLVFAFGTTAWSTASRGLFQHGPSLLMLTTALYLAYLARNRSSLIQYAALPLALAYTIRPTNSLSVIAFAVYVLLVHRRYFIQFCLWGLAIAALFVAHSWLNFNSWLPSYFSASRIGESRHFVEALPGNLYSPARGLFIYSPIFLFVFYGIYLLFRPGYASLRLMGLLLAGVVLIHWIVVSSFGHWYGGHSIGPRFFTDVVPYLVFLLIPVVDRIGRAGQTSLWLSVMFAITLVASVFIHFRGATSYAVIWWNQDPVSIDADWPNRIWDWRDPSFLRGVLPPVLKVSSPDDLPIVPPETPIYLPVTIRSERLGEHRVDWDATIVPVGMQLDGLPLESIDSDQLFLTLYPGDDALIQPSPGVLHSPEPLFIGRREQQVFVRFVSPATPGQYSLGTLQISATTHSGWSLGNSPFHLPLVVTVEETGHDTGDHTGNQAGDETAED